MTSTAANAMNGPPPIDRMPLLLELASSERQPRKSFCISTKYPKPKAGSKKANTDSMIILVGVDKVTLPFTPKDMLRNMVFRIKHNSTTPQKNTLCAVLILVIKKEAA